MTVRYFLKLSLINVLIRLLEWVVPKDYSLWMIGMDDGGGVRLSGNSWYFLNYLRKYEEDLRVVCVTSHDSVRIKLERMHVKAIRPNTFEAFWMALRSGVNFICGELHDEIPNFSKKDTIKVHLWHGVPLKRIFYGSKKMMERGRNRSFKMKILEVVRGSIALEDYDAIIYTSHQFEKIMKEAFNNPRVYLTGQPRDDAFYSIPSRDEILKELDLYEFRDHKIVCYLPTFRDSLDKSLSYKIFQSNRKAQSSLKNKKILVLQKDHNSIVEKRVKSGHVIHLTNEEETQKLLMVADVLITDYSSVYIDYLHIQRPIIFYCYDLEKYESQDRELYFDYFDDVITPGVKVRSEEELLEQILNGCSQPSLYESQRAHSLNFFHHYQDGKNSRRVAELTRKLIQRKIGA